MHWSIKLLPVHLTLCNTQRTRYPCCDSYLSALQRSSELLLQNWDETYIVADWCKLLSLLAYYAVLSVTQRNAKSWNFRDDMQFQLVTRAVVNIMAGNRKWKVRKSFGKIFSLALHNFRNRIFVYLCDLASGETWSTIWRLNSKFGHLVVLIMESEWDI